MRDIFKIVAQGEQRTLGRAAITNYEIEQIVRSAEGNVYKIILMSYHLGVELGFRKGGAAEKR